MRFSESDKPKKTPLEIPKMKENWDHQSVYDAFKSRGLEQVFNKRRPYRLLATPYVFLTKNQQENAMILRHPDSKYRASPVHVNVNLRGYDQSLHQQLKGMLTRRSADLDSNGFIYYAVPDSEWRHLAVLLGLQVALAALEFQALPSETQADFSPELAASGTAILRAAVTEVRHNHGIVVNQLAELLRQSGLHPGNDQRQDLIVVGEERIQVLFEVKSSASPYCVYTAIGQLMYHGSVQNPPPLRVAVLPESASAEVRERLRRLGIRLVTFRLETGQPRFDGLTEVLNELQGG